MIGVNEVRRVFRRRKIRRFVGLETRDEGLGLDAFASTESSPEVRAELSLLSEVLRRLPTNQRIAWSLRYVEGYALEEVAQACGFSLATAKRKIAAAQAHVRAVVDVEEGDRG
jgi:RNA polymerase sigma-70 factor, ECF subfamily